MDEFILGLIFMGIMVVGLVYWGMKALKIDIKTNPSMNRDIESSQSKGKIWLLSIFAGIGAGIIVEVLVILFLIAQYLITGELLSGEGSFDMAVAVFCGPILGVIVGIITMFWARRRLTRNTFGP